MALPKINHPTFSLELISNGKSIRYRPFTVKEEKILLVAQSSEDRQQIVQAIRQVIANCVIDTDFDVDKISSFDMEYIFINLRSKSVNNIVEIILRDNEDGKDYNFEINLDDIKIVKKENHSKKIQINDELGVVMRYPNFNEANMFLTEEDSDQVAVMLKMISKCIDLVYEGEKLYKAGEDFSEEEAFKFVNDLPLDSTDKFREFFDNFPEIEYLVEYKNSLGNDRTYKLNGISSFFL